MLADPAFLYKFLLEQAGTIGCSVWWEVKNRKERCVFMLWQRHGICLKLLNVY